MRMLTAKLKRSRGISETYLNGQIEPLFIQQLYAVEIDNSDSLRCGSEREEGLLDQEKPKMTKKAG